MNGRISLSDDTNLILGDGFTLDVKGIYIPRGSTLTIYGQNAGTGRICSHPSGGAAIGGYSEHDNVNIVIHGGTIEATGYNHCAGIGSNDGRTSGTITIYDDTITAKGGSDGASIGGGRYCSGGEIIIYGGEITATGGSNGAGIGGLNCNGGTITINGGKISATGGSEGSGIGSGKGGGNVAVFLGYTDATRDRVSITIFSTTDTPISGTVTLNQPFQNWNGVRLYLPGEQPDEKKKFMHDSPLVAWDREITSWERLQFAIDVTESGSTINLTQNIKATTSNYDKALRIPDGKSITIDLCCSTINRNLSAG